MLSTPADPVADDFSKKLAHFCPQRGTEDGSGCRTPLRLLDSHVNDPVPHRPPHGLRARMEDVGYRRLIRKETSTMCLTSWLRNRASTHTPQGRAQRRSATPRF